MPKITVVCPTMRVGGLDVLCSGLEGQSYKDFELVLSDGLFGSRQTVIEEMQGRMSFPIRHVEPNENPFPLNSFCRYSNAALAHASGEIVLFVTDYTWLTPGCLTRHAEQQEGPRKGRGLMCPHEYVKFPEVSESFPGYGREDVDAYEDDVRSGRLDGVMWSVFKDPFSGRADALPRDSMAGSDPKLSCQPGPVHATFFHGKNESCLLEKVLEVNGWDEAMDGTHGWQDSELAERLQVRTGLEWDCDAANVAWIVNPRHSFPLAKRTRPVEENKARWKTNKAAGFPVPENSVDLRKVRL